MSSFNKFEELKKLGELLEAGVLSQEEFDSEKARLMSDASELGQSVNQKDLYVPGTAPRSADLPDNAIVGKAAGVGFKKILIFITRLFLAINTIGISELVILGVKKAKKSRSNFPE